MNTVMGTPCCSTSLRLILRQLSKQLADNFERLGWKNQGYKGPGTCDSREKVRVAGAANDQGYERGCSGRSGFAVRSACSIPLLWNGDKGYSQVDSSTWQ